MRPLYGPRKKETPLADGRLDARTLCIRKGLGVRHEVVCALSSLEANDSQEKPVVCRSQLGEVFLAEGPRYAPVEQGFHLLGLYRAQLQNERGSLHIVQFPLGSTVACPCESDPPLISGIISTQASIRPPRYINCAVCLYLWPAASMARGEVQGARCGVRSSMVSVFFSDTRRPAALKTVTMTVIMLARPSATLDTFPASSAVIECLY